MSIDPILRDTGERILKLIGGIADRRGEPGTTKAARRRDDLRAALGDGDEDRTKNEIRGIYSHISKANYSTDSEWQRACELKDLLPDDLIAQIEEDATTRTSQPVKKQRLTIEPADNAISTCDARSTKERSVTEELKVFDFIIAVQPSAS